MITTTSYGSWLPGDLRGYVQKGIILPPNAQLKNHARSLMTSEPVCFSSEEQDRLFRALVAAADEFRYRLTDASVEAWHLHWIVSHPGPIKSMVGRLKTRMRQAMARGRIWTEGYHFSSLANDEELLASRKYIARHNGTRMLAGKIISPGRAGG